MKKFSTIALVPALLLISAVFAADDSAPKPEQQALRTAEVQSLLEEAERTRQEAEVAHRGAMKAAEMARETARMSAEEAREIARQNTRAAADNSEHIRQQAEQRQRERELSQQEIARAREELSKAHRELREATREVARAHRDLARTDTVFRVDHSVNLGDRAVIGVVLGKETNKGVQIIGISPDGPAERAGLQQGDILVSIRGVDLTNTNQARESVFEVMAEATDGEELAVTVDREGELWDYTVTAEHREPRSWQSVIRIPEVAEVGAVPGEERLFVRRIEIPDDAQDALAEQVDALTEELEITSFIHMARDGGHPGEHEYEYEIDFEKFSDFGGYAMSEADIWFGLPQAHGLELTAVNEGLGAYFKTDRGVLVIQAREDNAYQFQSGDVILTVGATEVNSPSDLLRTLRDADPGSALEIEIKRDRKDKTLSVVVPENRLGLR